ncbi:MAG: DUF4145 domain-containing protein [Planctomycetota bacterium]
MQYVIEKDSDNAILCPYCKVYSNIELYNLRGINIKQNRDPRIKPTVIQLQYFYAECHYCHKGSIWEECKDNNNIYMIYPNISIAPLPHDDMPETIKNDYEEARRICNASPRASAALLRLCTQKICKDILKDDSQDKIFNDIGLLVERGLPSEYKDMLDILRVYGNESVHPGELREEDIKSNSSQLFIILNDIVDYMISKPKKRKELLDNIPEKTRKAIEQRDQKKPTT